MNIDEDFARAPSGLGEVDDFDAVRRVAIVYSGAHHLWRRRVRHRAIESEERPQVPKPPDEHGRRDDRRWGRSGQRRLTRPGRSSHSRASQWGRSCGLDMMHGMVLKSFRIMIE